LRRFRNAVTHAKLFPAFRQESLAAQAFNHAFTRRSKIAYLAHY
jgi:hypothetical protein